jgi:Fe-S-cluster containining protein
MEHLFPELEAFYEDFTRELRNLHLEEADCGQCGRCCESPPFLMTCSDLEFSRLERFIEQEGMEYRLHFIPLQGDEPDRRTVWARWRCPLYAAGKGCVVYPVRPLSCRVFGPLAQGPIEFDFCVFKNPRIYETPLEIPLWENYARILRKYPFRRGYIFPDQTLYAAPILELLMGYQLPWSYMNNLALTL